TPPPPRPTLFPYTTLFRSLPAGLEVGVSGVEIRVVERAQARFVLRLEQVRGREAGSAQFVFRQVATALPQVHGQVAQNVHELKRSEEHTSELQSRSDLVCR